MNELAETVGPNFARAFERYIDERVAKMLHGSFVGKSASLIAEKRIDAPASGSPRVKFIDALVARAHGFSSASLHQFFTELRCRRLTTVYSASEPLPSLAYAGSPAKCHVSLVVGSVADHDCWCLARSTAHAGEQPVASILDLGTGRLWRREDVIGSPEVVARAEAILRSATRQYPARYKTTVAVQLDAGIPVLADRAAYEAAMTRLPVGCVGPPLPMWLTTPWAVPASKKSRTLVQHEVDAEERRLRGWDRPSDKARAALASAVVSTTKPRSTTGYICAVVNRGAASWTLESVVCRLDGRWVHGEGAAASDLLQKFRKEFPDRWFGPRIVDLLAWMKRHRITLPARAADPAWAAFVLDPEVDTDKPLDLASYSSRVLRLSTPSRSWLGDIKRNAPPPAIAEALEDTARALPVLDRNLRAHAGERTALRRLLDDDIEPMLTTLARIEGRGVLLTVPVGCADSRRRSRDGRTADRQPRMGRWIGVARSEWSVVEEKKVVTADRRARRATPSGQEVLGRVSAARGLAVRGHRCRQA